jgi:hypothetical protein
LIVISNNKARLFGVALAAVSAFSMVASPAYSAAPSGKRVSFQTTAAVMEYVKVHNPTLYQRLLQHRSGQGVKVTAKEHAYLKKLNRIVSQRAASSYEFSSQARMPQEARSAFAQQKKAEVVVTPKPWWDVWKEYLKAGTTAGAALSPFFPVLAPVMLVISIILIIVEAIGKVAETLAKK